MIEQVCSIPLSRGFVAVVSASDYEALSKFKWHARYGESSRSWYASRAVVTDGKQTSIPMARQILGLTTGDPRQADHINHNTLDNTRDNLRIATRKENCRNRRRRVDNVSSYKGVSWNKAVSKAGAWRAQIWINGTNKLIGHFTDPIAAAKAYDSQAADEFGEFAYLNFPVEAQSAPLTTAAA